MNLSSIRVTRQVAALLVGLSASIAWAAAPDVEPDKAPLVTLSANAQAQVPADEMVLTLRVQRDGPQLGTLNQAVLNELNRALAQAKTVPGVKARLGALGTSQTFGDKGKPTGWQVSGQVVLESRNMKGLGELSGALAERMQLGQVSFRLSDERRKDEQAALLKQAAEAFRSQAQAAASALGYSQYTLKEVNISQGGGIRPPMPMYAKAMRADGLAMEVPSEGGDVDVNVTLSGSVTLSR